MEAPRVLEPSRLLLRLDDPEQQLLDSLMLQSIGEKAEIQESSTVNEEDLWKLNQKSIVIIYDLMHNYLKELRAKGKV